MLRIRPHVSLPALAAVLACAMLGAPAAHAAPPCKHADDRAGDATEVQSAKATVCLLNKERTGRGLHTLRLNDRLSKAARGHTLDMVRRHYFEHVSKSGSDVVDRLFHVGYLHRTGSWMVGENLAWGTGQRSTPRQIMSAWMHSAGHRHNILTARFRDVGVGVAFRSPTGDGPVAATYTHTFGARG